MKTELIDWIKVSREVVNDPTAMKGLYDEQWVHPPEDEVIQSALTLDAIFVTCFLSSVHVREYSSSLWNKNTLQKLPLLRALDLVATKFFSKTLPNTQGLLSRESECSMYRILQDILKVENQIPLSVIRNVIKIMFPFRAAGRVIVEDCSIEAKDILRVICRTFVQTYEHIFPCLQLSGTGLAGVQTDGGRNSGEGTGQRISSPTMTYKDLQAEATAASVSGVAVNDKAHSVIDIESSRRDRADGATDQAPQCVQIDTTGTAGTGVESSTAEISELGQGSVAHTDAPHTNDAKYAATGDETRSSPEPGQGSGVYDSDSGFDTPASKFSNLEFSDSALPDFGSSESGLPDSELPDCDVPADLTECDHLLHCLAHVIWSKAVTTQPSRHFKGMHHILRKCLPRQEPHYLLKERIPTAKELRKSGINFRGQDGLFPRFRPHFLWWFSATLYLPRLINIEDRTEECWRNLLAFEDAYHNYHQKPRNKSFTSYLSWMGELIKNEEDVAVLMERKNPVILWSSTMDNKDIATLINSVTKGHLSPGDRQWRNTRKEISKFHSVTILRWGGEYCTPFFSKPWLLCSVLAAFTLLALSAIQVVYRLERYYST